jgi:CheY-like chemotaxis protein
MATEAERPFLQQSFKSADTTCATMTVPTILIVDDHDLFRRPIASRLQSAGYRTVEAADGARALELARRNRPALVLLDLVMKRATGVDFLRALRRDPNLKTTPVVVMTAATDHALVAKSSDIGVEGYLIKTTFSLDQLSSLVASLAGPAAAA